jgi:hypothetical protein
MKPSRDPPRVTAAGFRDRRPEQVYARRVSDIRVPARPTERDHRAISEVRALAAENLTNPLPAVPGELGQ